MLAEVLFRTGRDLQIVELMHLYVLRGRYGRWLLWTVFVLLSGRLPSKPGGICLRSGERFWPDF